MHQPFIRRLGLAFLVLVLQPLVPGAARALETAAQQAIIADYQTGTILLDKNADAPVHPASMTKLMTLYLLFDQLKQGKLSLTDTFTVSRTAWAEGKSQESNMFVALDSQVSIEDLLRGIVVQSGNDACLVVAEGIAGSQEAFVDLMNKRAPELGLTNSHFTNPDGLENLEHQMTARDILTLSERIYTDFPEYYHYFAEKEFTYNDIKQGNRNPLLYKNIGADGLKTGHLTVSGFGVAVSAERNGRRIFMVVHGLPSMQSRADESTRLLEWAFQSFQNVQLAKAGDVLEQAPVWYGAEDMVPLTVAKDLIATVPRGSRDQISAMAVFDAPVRAPIAAGQEIGRLVISAADDKGTTEVPLVAAAPVERLGMIGRAVATLKYLILSRS